ncbi:MAG: hypothetical protein AUH85_08155 [Chloroflexi bacterium 13_1_40CM_4_68_4]|nr:MAG: hypothetical protein AUH85_08155 [Chloroflexi bacterium 13_1_40CM_4_68_4]
METHEHDVDGRPGGEVSGSETMFDPQREPWGEKRRHERAVRRSEETLRRGTLQHEIRDTRRDVRLREPAYEIGGAIERRVREHDVRGVGHRVMKDVGLSHDDIRCRHEANAQPRDERRIFLDRDNTRRATCESRGEVPSAGAEVIHDVLGADLTPLDEPGDERRIAEEVLCPPKIRVAMP